MVKVLVQLECVPGKNLIGRVRLAAIEGAAKMINGFMTIADEAEWFRQGSGVERKFTIWLIS